MIKQSRIKELLKEQNISLTKFNKNHVYLLEVNVDDLSAENTKIYCEQLSKILKESGITVVIAPRSKYGPEIKLFELKKKKRK